MDYRIEAIDILLNEDCILQRYYPLIQYKEILIQNLLRKHCISKSECLKFSDDFFIEIGLPDMETASLFRSFLVMYDIKNNKLSEIKKVAMTESEIVSFHQLYLLPGVKAARARLYYDAGYRNLNRIASSLPLQLIDDTSKIIQQNNLNLKVPSLKEVRTHIAVAKTFTIYAI